MSTNNELITPAEGSDKNSINKTKMNTKTSGKKYFFLGALTTILLVVGIATFGFVTHWNHFGDHGPWGMMLDKVTKDLNLNDQQKSQLESIKAEIKAKMESNRQNKGKGMDDFSNAFLQDNLDKQTLMDIDTKHETARKEMREFYYDEVVKFHDLLTSSQRQQVVDKMKELKSQHKMHNKGNIKQNN
jgi:Spy/CpxP family protein refolding chaperone